MEMIQEKKDEKDVSLKRLQTGVDKIDEAELDIAGHSWTKLTGAGWKQGITGAGR